MNALAFSLQNKRVAELSEKKCWDILGLVTLILAFSYINSDWSSQPMWITNPTFNKVDSRLQVSKYVAQKWKNEMENPKYLKASEGLWNEIIKN